ncbi:hypothetical protein LL06_00895 [Hoeflea sp. BAL378]|uniref:hypothetical protein n=1 Tax=Hoeflea sp. BAL378 TaxID=1547437 RepID=UPI00051462B1|nr:hypothetical protein [Hoeflea sp. BAL378]KGF71181.1 hypothetical protein LL06_00895 [Hoeflea sp. BAL378]
MTAILRLAPEPVWSFRPDGSVRDLAAPDPAEIDFYAMANALSKIARFNGSNPGVAYSVAQHSVMGADAILNETGDARLAALFLLHDGEEHLVGDKPTPAQRLLNATISASTHTARRSAPKFMTITRQQAEEAGALAHFSWDAIKFAWREAGWLAAGLILPNAFEQDHLNDFDRRMCNAEMVALFGPSARAQAIPVAHKRPLRLKGGIKPWAAMKAEERFVEAAQRLIGEERMLEQRALHAAHVALTS